MRKAVKEVAPMRSRQEIELITDKVMNYHVGLKNRFNVCFDALEEKFNNSELIYAQFYVAVRYPLHLMN